MHAKFIPTTLTDRDGTAAVDLYWLPLGAGGHSVRVNGKIFEAVAARLSHRSTCDLYHSALEVTVGSQRFVIEMAPVWDANGAERGAVAEGPVGTSWAGCSRLFRYEIRRWHDGQIPTSRRQSRARNASARTPPPLESPRPRPARPYPDVGPRPTRHRRDVELKLRRRVAARHQRD